MIESNFINNQWLVGKGAEFTSFDSAKAQPLATVSSVNDEQLNEAVEAALSAFNTWRYVTLEQRIAFVKAYQEQLHTHSESLAMLIAQETGKPLWEAKGEVGAMIAKIDISIRAFHERTGQCQSGQAELSHKPHGVVAVFGPYNFPGHLPNGHIVPALIAGNTVVFKPSEQTPLVAIEMVRLWQQAGLPEGVLNVVHGFADIGQSLVAHPQVKGIFFTGSSTTGQHIHRATAGQTGRILALEMGGNNPLIVCEVSDIAAAVYHIIQSAFISSGQRCTCARRLLLPDTPWGDTLLQALLDKTRDIIPACYDADPQPFMGALISNKAAQQMLETQNELMALRGEVLQPMRLLQEQTGLLSPGIIDVTNIKNALPDEEHFGPLLKVIRYHDFDQAIELANNTRFGLSAGLLSDDPADFARCKIELNAGILNWNSPTTGAKGDAPFGGIGDSGNHRPGAYYAADYCTYPVATVRNESLQLPASAIPGLSF